MLAVGKGCGCPSVQLALLMVDRTVEHSLEEKTHDDRQRGT